MIRGSVILFLMVPVGLHAQEQGDPAAGLRVARETCAACHAVEAGQTRSPHAQAPTFTQIARVPGMTTTALTVAMRTSHETMPNIMLEPKELQDVTAYITSLYQHP
ncbi:c-type cytochrome [Microvirga sp. 2MCAF35]|uniref:c-type cytochrome n=1 Tax=Microvirga sp. 2MCAF35 TaxID=3232987 RepID=UPI003F9A683A